MARRTGPAPAGAATTVWEALEMLGERERSLVLALAIFPLAGVPFLAALDPAMSERSAAASLRSLAEQGLAARLALPNPGGRPHAAWYLRDAGVAVAAAWLGRSPAALARDRRLRRADLLRALEAWPFTTALYDAALRLIAAAPPGATIAGWTRDLPVPGSGSGPPTSLAGTARARRLPATLALAWRDPDSRRRILARGLIPDIPHFPPGRWAATLAAYARAGDGSDRPPLLIAAADHERAADWASLCALVVADAPAATAGGGPEIVLPDGRRWAAGRAVGWDPAAAAPSREPGRVAAWARAGRPDPPGDGRAPRLVGDGPCGRAGPPRAVALSRAHWQLLHDVAVLPYMPGEALRLLRGWSPPQFERLRAALTRDGLVRLVSRADAPGAAPGDLRRGLLEATHAGLSALAASGGLDLATLARDRSYVGGDPDRPVGARRLLLRQIRHTVAVGDWLTALLAGFAALRAADPATPRALRWSGPVAAAVGPFWPDGGLAHREGEREHRYFVEIDRGTEDRGDFGRKFRGYRALLDAPGFLARHDGLLPPLLLVAARGADAARIAGYARDEAAGRPWAIPLWLATADAVRRAPFGPYSAIWRAADGTAAPLPLLALRGVAPCRERSGGSLAGAATTELQ